MVNIDRLIDEKFSYFFLKENATLATEKGESLVLYKFIDANSSEDEIDRLSRYLYSCIINKTKISIEVTSFSKNPLSFSELERLFNPQVLSYIENKFLYLIMVEKYKNNPESLLEKLHEWKTLSVACRCNQIGMKSYFERKNVEALISCYQRIIFKQAHPITI